MLSLVSKQVEFMSRGGSFFWSAQTSRNSSKVEFKFKLSSFAGSRASQKSTTEAELPVNPLTLNISI